MKPTKSLISQMAFRFPLRLMVERDMLELSPVM